MYETWVFRPSGACVVVPCTHGLRRGLHSDAASRLYPSLSQPGLCTFAAGIGLFWGRVRLCSWLHFRGEGVSEAVTAVTTFTVCVTAFWPS